MNSRRLLITVGERYLIRKQGKLMEFMVAAMAGKDYFHVMTLSDSEATTPYWNKWMDKDELKKFLEDVEMMAAISVQGGINISLRGKEQ